MRDIPYSDKLLSPDSFVEILEAIDDKTHKEPTNEKLKKIQGALYEVLAKVYEYETLYKKEDALFPYEIFINIEVIANQYPHIFSDDIQVE
jgi:hypothetical protein